MLVCPEGVTVREAAGKERWPHLGLTKKIIIAEANWWQIVFGGLCGLK
jgi:hypothetical protein